MNIFLPCTSSGFRTTVPPLLPLLPARKATSTRKAWSGGGRKTRSVPLEAQGVDRSLSCPPNFLTSAITAVPSSRDQRKRNQIPPSSKRELSPLLRPGRSKGGEERGPPRAPSFFLAFRPFTTNPYRRKRSHSRPERGGATFSNCSRELCEPSRDPTPDLCARETPLLPFPWLAARRPHGKAGSLVHTGRGASGPDSPSPNACLRASGYPCGAAPPPAAAATCERQARTCRVGAVRNRDWA